MSGFLLGRLFKDVAKRAEGFGRRFPAVLRALNTNGELGAVKLKDEPLRFLAREFDDFEPNYYGNDQARKAGLIPEDNLRKSFDVDKEMLIELLGVYQGHEKIVEETHVMIRTEKDITPIGWLPHYGVVKDDYLLIKGCCVGTKKKVVTLRQSLLKQTSRLALEEINIITF
ncbi:60S ribosomal protein L3-2 [Platanthera guangdongensis]|uniref:60S ribosomal protein L3-2 n=1 Tax=Platanthera guangdongensis TaxID=2320717 RepID=A0ABR2N4K0_9ASPA